MRNNLTLAFIAIAISLLAGCCSPSTENSLSPRSNTLLDKDWTFVLGEGSEEGQEGEIVAIPHDWAIKGPFDRNNDLQDVAVVQNFEKESSVKTGRTGGLPYVGVGTYTRTFKADTSKLQTILFDGAMSEARIWINGQEAGYWPYGYNSFYIDATPYINKDGSANTIKVRLENRPQSSRWYPGAGLYRNVHLIQTGKVHIPVWGTRITTESIAEGEPKPIAEGKSKPVAKIRIQTEIEGLEGKNVLIKTTIKDAAGNIAASNTSEGPDIAGQCFTIENAELWSPEHPALYIAETQLLSPEDPSTVLDAYSTRFGIRTIGIVPDKGFFLNGQNRKFKGVCLHHDLGPLGTAVNTAALRHQLAMLKEMGCDAIRTTHNMPAPEQIALCEEMGFMVIVENFDEWDVAKCENGYHRFFKEWVEKDMVNMIRQYRNSPAVVMWSIGNEVPTQWKPEGYKVATYLREICHREDPSRPVTCGMDQIDAVLGNGFAAIMDVPGFNYRTHRYLEAYKKLPQKILLGSETASTVSSRGVYHFPVEIKPGALYEDHQSSSYDLESCWWSNVPDEDFALADDYPWTMGQFVWTGFDYLGEPSPYDTDAWPNHSSLFGIIDLASIPKDRYWLYRSQWNTIDQTLYILPHWTWLGREGEVTPVFVYTSYPSAELFINGESRGRRFKNDSTLQHRYRLMWMDARYEPGELKVIAYDAAGKKAKEKIVRTAGAPDHIVLNTDRKVLKADGKDLAYITVSIVDKEGNLCPQGDNTINFNVTGNGSFKACANGDPTSLELFHVPSMKAFSGQLTAIVLSGEESGRITLEASSEGLTKGIITIKTK